MKHKTASTLIAVALLSAAVFGTQAVDTPTAEASCSSNIIACMQEQADVMVQNSQRVYRPEVFHYAQYYTAPTPAPGPTPVLCIGNRFWSNC